MGILSKRNPPPVTGRRGHRSRKDPEMEGYTSSRGSTGSTGPIPLPRPGVRILPSAAFARYLEHHVEINSSPHTITAHQKTWDLFQRYLDEQNITDVWDISSSLVQDWLTAQRLGKSLNKPTVRSVETVRTYGRHIKACLHWLEDQDLLPARVADRVTLPAVQASEKKTPVTFTNEEVSQLLTAAQQDGAKTDNAERHALSLRNLALLAILLDSGVRREELCSMQVEDIDWRLRTLRVRESKTETRIVGFGKAMADVHLRAYVNQAKGRPWLAKDNAGHLLWEGITEAQGPLWLNRDGGPLTGEGVKMLFQRLAKRTQLAKQCSSHVCRRYAITNALKNGMSILDAARYFSVGPEVIFKHYYAPLQEEIVAAAQHASPMDEMVRQRLAQTNPKGGRQRKTLPNW